MKIAVIDSGVDTNHKRLTGAHITGIRVTEDSEKYSKEELEDFNDILGHGTACTSIIYSHIRDIELVSLKIFDVNLISSEQLLINAINWCIENNVEIINLSLGIQTLDPVAELYQICKKAYDANIILIAAANNNLKLECYPAYYPMVLGVTSGRIKEKGLFGFIRDSCIEFVAKGSIQRVAWKDNQYKIVSGSSYACAHFTGIVASILQKHKFSTIDNLKDYLISSSNDQIEPISIPDRNVGTHPLIIWSKNFDKIAEDLFNPKNKFQKIRELAIFPASEKEINTFQEFSNLCVCKLVKIIDYPRNISKNKIFINRMITDSECDDFDSIVMGYFYEHLFESNVKFGFELLNKIIINNKNIFIFDFKLKEIIENCKLFKNYTGRIYLPSIDKGTFDNIINFRYLKDLKVPVLAVVGTSNRQGKLTTQLRIREILRKEGYNISHIATEPHGELLGADYSFPYGYNGTVKIKRENWGLFLHCLLKGIQEYNKPHLIITGTQGGTIPRAYNTTPFGTELSSLDFLYGIQPDIIICVINAQDTIELINETVQAVKIYTKAKVIFYALTPWLRQYDRANSGNFVGNHKYLNKEEFKKKIYELKEKLNDHVIDVMDSSNDKFILSKIQNSLS